MKEIIIFKVRGATHLTPKAPYHVDPVQRLIIRELQLKLCINDLDELLGFFWCL